MLERIKSRAALRAKGDYQRYKRGACFGYITPVFPSPEGSAIGSIPVVAPSSLNLVINSSSPALTTDSPAGKWTNNGGSSYTLGTTYQFDAGFIPIILSGAAVTDNLSNNSILVTAASTYTVSGYFSVDPKFIGALSNASPQVKFEVEWSTGRKDSVTFVPANGNITATSSPFVTAAHSTQLAVQQNALPGIQAIVYRIDFTTSKPVGAVTPIILRVYPRTDQAAAGDVICGGFQIEQLGIPTAYIPTSYVSVRLRSGGLIPQQVIGQFYPPQYTSIDYTYQAGIDAGQSFIMGTAAKTFTLPDIPITSNGEYCWIINDNTGNTTIAASNCKLYGPGLASAGVTSMTFPSVGTGATYPNAALLAVWDDVKDGWRLYSVNADASGGGGSNPIQSVLAQSAIPFVIPATGSMGNNGALTIGTALLLTYANAYFYMPAGAISAGSAAGWYYGQCSSTTAATLFNNTYAGPGQPTIPASPTPFVTVGPGAYTGETNVIDGPSFTLPANSMGKNGSFNVEFECSVTDNANPKTRRLQYGGQDVFSATGSAANFKQIRHSFTTMNRGVTNSQFVHPALGQGGWGAATTVMSTPLTVDSTAAQTIATGGAHPTATDNYVIEYVRITATYSD